MSETNGGDGQRRRVSHAPSSGLAVTEVGGLRFVLRGWKQIAVVVWLAFSITLAGWWLMFGLKQISRLQEIGGAAPPGVAREIERQHRMLMSEGATLVILLLGGGGALLYYINTEIKRNQRVRSFFAAFTHDLKTSLASLRLQAESLEEDLKDSGQSRLLKRLVKDTVRLELQLENALLLASPNDSSRLLLEPLKLSEILGSIAHQWPDLTLQVDGDATVIADRRALESIVKNLLQNSVVHGRADRVIVKVDRNGAYGTIRMEDNGRGFKGDRERLGEMFSRHASTSGSGLGLYLARDLATRMGGALRFPGTGEGGFTTELVLPEAELPEEAT